MIGRLSPLQKTLISIALVSLALVIYFGFSWARNQSTAAELETHVQTAQMALSRIENRIAGPSFPPAPPGLQLVDLAVRSAQDAGMEVISVRSSPSIPEQIGRNVYRATRASIHVAGDSNQIVAFMDLMELQAISSMATDNIEVDWIDDHWEVSLDVFAYATPG